MALHLPKSLLNFPKEQLKHPVVDEQISADGLNHVDIDMQFLGQVLIVFDAEESAHIRAAGNAHLMPDTIERYGDRLIIGAKNIGSLVRNIFHSKLIMELHLPEHCSLNINFVAGAVALFGGTGALSVQGAFGEVAGLSYSPSTLVRMSCGTVNLIELKGAADIRIGFGSTEIGLSKTTGREQMRLRCGVGSIELTVVPQDAPESDHGGFFKNKMIVTPAGSRIEASVGIGAIETMYG
ncbi:MULTISPECIES: hypothetical protein [unclassified Paenibacillus]|uniref:hypothetical protein n=1 Tax=unclassified Paenibacillus TaxID=185978 RepID=UPI002F4224A6